MALSRLVWLEFQKNDPLMAGRGRRRAAHCKTGDRWKRHNPGSSSKAERQRGVPRFSDFLSFAQESACLYFRHVAFVSALPADPRRETARPARIGFTRSSMTASASSRVR